MPLIGFLGPDHLRLQDMSNGTFELVLAAVVVFVALIDDVGASMLAAALNNGDTFDELVHGVLPGRGNEISVATRFDSICVPPEASNRFARPWAAAGPEQAEDPAPSCATSGRAEIPGLEEFMVTRIQGFGNRAFAIGERYHERAVRGSLRGPNAARRSRSGAPDAVRRERLPLRMKNAKLEPHSTPRRAAGDGGARGQAAACAAVDHRRRRGRHPGRVALTAGGRDRRLLVG